jgi:hypothetical protein
MRILGRMAYRLIGLWAYIGFRMQVIFQIKKKGLNYLIQYF